MEPYYDHAAAGRAARRVCADVAHDAQQARQYDRPAGGAGDGDHYGEVVGSRFPKTN